MLSSSINNFRNYPSFKGQLVFENNSREESIFGPQVNRVLSIASEDIYIIKSRKTGHVNDNPNVQTREKLNEDDKYETIIKTRQGDIFQVAVPAGEVIMEKSETDGTNKVRVFSE